MSRVCLNFVDVCRQILNDMILIGNYLDGGGHVGYHRNNFTEFR